MTDFNLGAFARPVTTTSPQAQKALNAGLIWMYGFNHEQAIVCFQEALTADPTCALAHWGIAHAIGPNYNKVWGFFSPDEQIAALALARQSLSLAATCPATPVEQALIVAQSLRFPTDPHAEDCAPYNDAFADAMRAVHHRFPTDLDVTSLFAEALMNRTPWTLWDTRLGQPTPGSSTTEAQALLEATFARYPAAWDHPGLLHMYIHLMEMSPTPERALRHGDRLMTLVPDSGHLVHMATHIDLLCGDYQNTVQRNHAAALVDAKYFAHAGGENFYTVYRIHNLHFELYGALFLAQITPALAAADALVATLPDPVVRHLPQLFEAFVAMKPHALIRFGRWAAILALPFPQDAELYSYTTAILHYARTVALANLSRLPEAEAEAQAFTAATARVQEDRMMFNNPCAEVLKVAHQMMLGELAYKSGRIDDGLAHLRASVALDDSLLYDEPWGWMQPTRHALGALLMDAGHYPEAEAVYRADLGLDATLPRPSQHPRNVWSLHGLDESLARRGETVERPHIRQQLAQAMARAEVPISASCFCRSQSPTPFRLPG
jgi:tetratricopeptide (TPR) repeat protein